MNHCECLIDFVFRFSVYFTSTKFYEGCIIKKLKSDQWREEDVYCKIYYVLILHKLSAVRVGELKYTTLYSTRMVNDIGDYFSSIQVINY